MGILKVLTILCLILFPFGELLRIDLARDVVIRPLDAVAGITAISWVYFSYHKKLKQPVFSGRVFLFIAVAALSLLVNITWLKPGELLVSFLYLVRWISYALLAFVIFACDEKFKKKVTKFLLWGGSAVLLFGYLQFFLYPSLKNLIYLGWDEHMYRMFSVFFDPNFAGAFLVLYFLFVCGLLRENLKKKSLAKSKLLISLVLFTLIGVFLTFSRSALLMLFAGTFVFLYLIKKKRLFFVLLGLSIVFFLMFSSKFYLENINLFRANSSLARINASQSALRMIGDRPILGVGFNTYRYAKSLYGYKMGDKFPDFPSHADAGADNSLLFVTATTGILGLAAYLFMWSGILRSAMSKKASTKNIVLISSIAGLFVSSLFINSLFFPEIMFWMGILVGISEYES